MYNAHRGMLPQHQMPNNRLTELLDQVRAEFEAQVGRQGEDQHQRESFIHQQVQELEHMRQRVSQLEAQHNQMKQDYEMRIRQVQQDVDSGRPHQPVQGAQHSQQGPSQPPPAIGHGPRDLFGQIMSGSSQQQQPLGPPPEAPQQPQGLPVHLTQGAAMGAVPQQHPYGGYQGGPTLNGYAPQPPPPTSPKNRPPRNPQGQVTPQQAQAAPYQSPRQNVQTPPPGQRHAPTSAPYESIENQPLAALTPDKVPPEYKREGDEWWAVFNPKLPRRLDVELVHTLVHKSVVCCVRFSHDGNYVATGCNRAAQIFEVQSGQLVAHLEDENAERDGDLYIRSVCFSPDGKFLATGAEDRKIRVWDIASKTIKHVFEGHEQDIYSLDFSPNGRSIASGSGDKTVRIWNLDQPGGEPTLILTIEDGVTTVALSADGRLVAAGSLDRSVRVWDCETGSKLEVLDGNDGHADSVYSVAFSPSGRELVSGSLDRTIKMWQLSPPPPAMRGQFGNQSSSTQPKGTGRCIRTFEGHIDFVLSVALTPDTHWVLSGSKDRGVQFWDPETGIAQLYLQGHRNSVISVAPGPKDGIFATGSGDQKARIWRYKPYQGR